MLYRAGGRYRVEAVDDGCKAVQPPWPCLYTEQYNGHAEERYEKASDVESFATLTLAIGWAMQETSGDLRFPRAREAHGHAKGSAHG